MQATTSNVSLERMVGMRLDIIVVELPDVALLARGPGVVRHRWLECANRRERTYNGVR